MFPSHDRGGGISSGPVDHKDMHDPRLFDHSVIDDSGLRCSRSYQSAVEVIQGGAISRKEVKIWVIQKLQVTVAGLY